MNESGPAADAQAAAGEATASPPTPGAACATLALVPGAATAGTSHAPPPTTAPPAGDDTDDGDVSTPVATALAFLRNRVPPDSLALLSTRGNSLDSLGVSGTHKLCNPS